MEAEAIQALLEQLYPFLSAEERSLLYELGTIVHLEKRGVYIEMGSLQQKAGLILKGMVRGYYLKENGEEWNLFLRPEHTFVGSPGPLFSQTPSQYTYEAVCPTVLLSFDFAVFQQAAYTHPGLGRVIQEALIEVVQVLLFRLESMVNKLPEERYEELIEKRPQFFQQAFQKHVANYLGISAVSLSRIIRRSQGREKGSSINPVE